MAEHGAAVEWVRGDAAFNDKRYSRRHVLRFDGGTSVPGSSSPHVVPVPFSDPAGVDPEELLIASLASCHMLWFLDLAATRGFRVDQYTDAATGTLRRNAERKLVVAEVVLRPEVAFSGDRRPTRAELDALHHAAHEECFIANSVRTVVRCEPVYGDLA